MGKNSDIYVEDHRYQIAEIEKLVGKRIEQWQSSSPSAASSPDRCVYIIGAPGVGKSALLRWITKRYKALYLDLDMRLDAPNIDWFTWKLTEKIRRYTDKNRQGILCIDHIPKRMDDAIRQLHNIILDKLLQNPDYFLVLAPLENTDIDLLSEPPPTPENKFELRGFDGGRIDQWKEGLEKKYNAMRCEGYRDMYQDMPEHWPKLIDECCKHGVTRQAAERALKYWLTRRGVQDDSDANRLIHLAQVLGDITDLSAIGAVNEKLGQDASLRDLTPFAARQMLRRVGWWQILSEGGGGWSGLLQGALLFAKTS